MIKIIKKLLEQIIDNIDVGNSNLSEQEQIDIIKQLKQYTEKDVPMSKYQAFNYLHISRASFDNLVKENKIPKGKKQQGFTEKFWFKKDLDLYKKNNK